MWESWRWVVTFTPLQPDYRGSSSQYPMNKGLSGLQAFHLSFIFRIKINIACGCRTRDGSKGRKQQRSNTKANQKLQRTSVMIYKSLLKPNGNEWRQWCGMLKNKQIFTMKSKVVGRSSVTWDGFVQNVDKKNVRITTLHNLIVSHEFPQVSRTVLYEIITVRLSCHEVCARWVPKILMDGHKTQRMTFYSDITKVAMNFLITSYEWMSKPKNSQSSGCTHVHQISQKV
jgi:hypothetical protein